MSAQSKIEWTDATWNPVRGCTHVSEGCRHCYAERMYARQLPGLRSPATGARFAIMQRGVGPHWSGKVELIESQLEIPLHWRKPRRIFVNSMSDTFHESLPDEAIDRIFAVMARCPQHTFMVLTKRAARMREWFSESRPFRVKERIPFQHGSAIGQADEIREFRQRWPLPNVWLGVSCEDQKTADERIPLLLQTPAAVRFVSLEPLLEDLGELDLTGIHWVIAGGESGPGARPMHPDWVRRIVQRCKAAGVAVFIKQILDHGKKLPMDQWPEDLRVREFPRVHSASLATEYPVEPVAASFPTSREGRK